LLLKARNLSQRAAAYAKRLAAEADSLGEEVASLERALARAGAAAAGAAAPPAAARALDAARRVLVGDGPGGDLRKLRTAPRPALLSAFLGASTSVASLRRDQALRIREEYARFRNRSAYAMFAAAVALLATTERAARVAAAGGPRSLSPVAAAGFQAFICGMLFFYTASALRESVLKANGSHIRAWWIRHHAFAMANCVLVLSLPASSPSLARARALFLRWAAAQAVVIVLQNRYQRRRLYTRIALGKSSALDLPGGDAAGAHGQLLVLYPALFALQALQAAVGAEMLRWTYRSLPPLSVEGFLDPESGESDLWGSRGVALSGAAMLYMAGMNFWHTADTLAGKFGGGARRPPARASPPR
jgi:hypothetical protein